MRIGIVVSTHFWKPLLASTCLSEQLFSAAGQLYAERRSNLPSHDAEKLLFLNYDICLFAFKY